jgi:hypothetical protein
MTEMPTDDLAAEIAAHRACCDGSPKHRKHRPYCWECKDAWPCLVRRLADDRERLRTSMEYFVRYWWEHHQPDERDLEMARKRLDDPDIRAIVEALSGDRAAPSAEPDAGGDA